MQETLRNVARFGLDDEDGFQAHMRREPCSVVLFRGRQCPYSAAIEPHFVQSAASDEEWSFVVRETRSGGKGEVNERHDVQITPTVVAYRDGQPWRRLEARPLVGIPKHRLLSWLDELDDRAC